MKEMKKITVVVDNENRVLLITKEVERKLKTDLSSPEVKSYFAFKNMFPTYKDVVVPTLGKINYAEVAERSFRIC